MHCDVKKILINEEEICKRTNDLATLINEDYKDSKGLILVGLLKGSVPFLAELIKNIHLDMEIDFMDVSSYEGTESTGDIKVLKDLDRSIKNIDILIVEDIVDTGRTLKTVKELLYNKGANDVKVVTLLDKPTRRVVDLKAEYVGFEIPDEFVIGFGLDFNQKYRNLPYIAVLKDKLYQ